jgi:hypothetical protein
LLFLAISCFEAEQAGEHEGRHDQNCLGKFVLPALHWNVSKDQVNARGLARGVSAVPSVIQATYICPKIFLLPQVPAGDDAHPGLSSQPRQSHQSLIINKRDGGVRLWAQGSQETAI